MPFEPDLPSWVRGDPILADQLDTISDGLGRLLRQYGTEVDAYDDGSPRISDFVIRDVFLGVTTKTPCYANSPGNAPSDYKDARYYVKRQVITGGQLPGSIFNIADDTTPGGLLCVTATNLAELSIDPKSPINGTHCIPEGTTVLVVGFVSQAAATAPRSPFYVFYLLPPTGRFIITATATPPGVYKASTFVPSTTPLDPTSSTMWTSSQLGTSLGDSVYIYNLQEQGKSAAEPSQWDLKSNALDNGLQPIVTAVFHSIASDGVPVYLFWGPIAENCGQ